MSDELAWPDTEDTARDETDELRPLTDVLAVTLLENLPEPLLATDENGVCYIA